MIAMGGGGGFAQARLTVRPGDRLQIMVGGGGQSVVDGNPGAGGYGGGAHGGGGEWGAAGGGGRTELRRVSARLIGTCHYDLCFYDFGTDRHFPITRSLNVEQYAGNPLSTLPLS